MGGLRSTPLTVAALLAAALVAVPVVTVAAHVFLPGDGAWSHIVATVLPDYIRNSLWLVLGTGLGVLLLGVPTAWLVATCDFPGRRVFEWALVLPLAVPGYVIAYVYTDFLQVSGPVQTWLRDLTGWSARDYWFPPIRSLGGAVAMLSLVLYPYVYLLTRAAFLQQSRSLLEASRSLGCTPWEGFRRIALPLARPALVAGTMLALMETLADFGTVSYFGVPVFTTGIYRAWFSMGDSVAAAKLSALLLLFVLVLLTAERWNRGAMRFHQVAAPGEGSAHRLTGARAAAAVLVCGLPLALGFLLPATLLLGMALEAGDAAFGPRYFRLVGNTVLLAGITALLAAVIAVLIGYGRRLSAAPAMRAAHRVAGLGYAVPGSIMAVGVLIPLAALDGALTDWLAAHFGRPGGLLLTGGIVGLVYAYLARFLVMPLNAVDAGLARITPSMDAAARSLGESATGTLRRVHAPMLRGSLLTGILLVFVEVMKELPATMILRPFDFDTLAVQAHNLAADERLAEAATAALAIVAAGLVPVVLLSRQIGRRIAADAGSRLSPSFSAA
jgi:iron(III) transport system permease protein